VARAASPTATPAPDTTTKWYDGEERLVEISQQQDTSYDTYTKPWMTRYLYDLTSYPNNTVAFNGGAASYTAFGNLYKTQELLPAGVGPVTQTATTPQSITNSTFQDLKGAAFDAVGRPVAKYSLLAENGASTESLSTETMTYDGTNEYGTFVGQLTSDCNGMSQCKYPGYDALERMNAIGFTDANTYARSYIYDADGRTSSITSTGYSPQTYTYDANGDKLTEQEVSGAGTTSSALFTHVYYPDGTLQQINVTSSGLTQTGLFAYSYRPDGLVQTQAISDAAQANVGTTSVGWTYDSSGRATQRTESGPGGNPNPTTWSYDKFGRLAQVNYPTCAQCGTAQEFSIGYSSYDPQGQPLLAGLMTATGAPSVSYLYTKRGEPSGSVPVSGLPAFYANGVPNDPVTGGYAGSSDATTYSTVWDSRSGASISRTVNTPWTDNSLGINGTAAARSAFTYDAAGRMTADTSSVSGAEFFNYSDTLARTYDDENHTITSTDTGGPSGLLTAYNWGPAGHPVRIGSAPPGSTSPSSVQYDTLHWDGDQLVFQTNPSGHVDDIKIGTSGDITPLDPSFTGLTFWDRGPANPTTGVTMYLCHNINGTSVVGTATNTGCGGSWLQSNGNTYKMAGPTSFLFTSAEFGGYKSVPKYQIGIGQGALLGLARDDGMTDGLNTLQGVRNVDVNAGTWTTPDAYPGNVDDPVSQKSYLLDNGNPISNRDPSGYMCANCYSHDPLGFWNADPSSGIPTDTGLQSLDQLLSLDPGPPKSLAQTQPLDSGCSYSPCPTEPAWSWSQSWARVQPDAFSFTVSGGYWGGAMFHVTADRFGRIYWGLGAGGTTPGVTAALTANYVFPWGKNPLKQPSSSEVLGVLSQGSGSISATYGVSASIGGNATGLNLQVGGGAAPSFSIMGSYSWVVPISGPQW
jgi:YD repeat-containing protein